ncbi:unnamed protein product [Blepharisma stoltei]|uniref:Uncharacterized protein n=1 Tax=Blepharisma stoltei TaxID=1481888 RepID=A0AAU9JV49_9CILI|nr:unnamed protein product [Blepharisma stoltei]
MKTAKGVLFLELYKGCRWYWDSVKFLVSRGFEAEGIIGMSKDVIGVIISILYNSKIKRLYWDIYEWLVYLLCLVWTG